MNLMAYLHVIFKIYWKNPEDHGFAAMNSTFQHGDFPGPAARVTWMEHDGTLGRFRLKQGGCFYGLTTFLGDNS